MTGRSSSKAYPSIPPELSEIADTEFKLHREFVLRHIDFLIETLTAEQVHRYWQHPNGCPQSTPAKQCLERSNGEKFPCQYEQLTIHREIEADCDCNDPLARSEAPLDTVAAVAIAGNNRSPSQRYFDTVERQIISQLRANVGEWEEIATFSKQELGEELEKATPRRGIGDERVSRLYQFLSDIEDSSRTNGFTLQELPRLPYESLCDFLSSLTGISRTDAWWVMLVALDKPVWPVDPFIDPLLCNLGLLSQKQLTEQDGRHWSIEDDLSDKRIRQLHRALAGHAVKGAVDTCCDTCEIRKFLLSFRYRKQRASPDGPVVIDLFSGAGGLSLGFWESELDCQIDFAIDNNQHATDTFRFNHPEVPHERIICDDIREVMEGGLSNELDRKPDIVVGGPPCQSLSKAGDRTCLPENSILKDERTVLYKNFVSAIEELQPKAFVMENVEGMMSEIGDSGVKVGDLVVNELQSVGASGNGYSCDFKLINASEYGIPQDRTRVIIIGIREDLFTETDLTGVSQVFNQLSNRQSETEFTLRHGLSGLPKIRRGEGGVAVPRSVRGSRSEYVTNHKLEAGTNLKFNHRAREHPMEKDQILFDEALEPGDTGWDVKYRKDGEYSGLIDYDVGTEDNPRFKTKYRMLEWKEPSPTIIAHLAKDANGYILPDYYEHVPQTVGEPDNERNRGLTPREAARLQSFPDQYIFLGPFTSWFRQIGNAVPPVLGKHIANTLSEYLSSSATVSRPASATETTTQDD